MTLPVSTALRAAVDAFQRSPRPLRLLPGVKHYAWGDSSFIPGLIGVPGGGRPWAELWMGAHPSFPSGAVVDGMEVPLDALLAAAPDLFLGAGDARRFGGRLPFLLKVLTAAEPLSLQAHPDLRRAREGFRKEEAAGVPPGSPERVYKDDGHKPEQIVALTEFFALCGFRPEAELAGLATEVPELGEAPGSGPGPLRALYERLMSPASDAALARLRDRLQKEDARRPFSAAERGYWFLRAGRLFPGDRGLWAVYLLNLVRLRQGEALSLEAGVLHSYLGGAGVEVMANSDNVLRGGLTAKPVNGAELLKILTFESGARAVRRGAPGPAGRTSYREPGDAEEFHLRRIDLEPGRPDSGVLSGLRVGFVLEAAAPVAVESAAGGIWLEKGGAYLAPAGLPCILSCPGRAAVFEASVPGVDGAPPRP